MLLSGGLSLSPEKANEISLRIMGIHQTFIHDQNTLYASIQAEITAGESIASSAKTTKSGSFAKKQRPQVIEMLIFQVLILLWRVYVL